jgi:hypothetical protein
MIDVEHESELLKQRSHDLAAQLGATVVVVDRTGIEEALAESRRLAERAAAARAAVAARLAAGQQPGAALGPFQPIRKVRTLPDGRDPDPHLQGRVAVTAELLDFHTHRRDVVAAAYREAFARAGARLDARPALVAAAKGHLSLLRERGSFTAEGGDRLDRSLRSFLDIAGTLRAGQQEADEIAAAAEVALTQLRAAPLQAVMEAEGGPMADLRLASFAVGRMSAAMGGEPLDAASGKPIGKPTGRRR